MDLERERSRPQIEPQRQPARPEPRIQRSGPRTQPEFAPPPPPPVSGPPDHHPPPPGGHWNWGRLIAVVLLLVSAGVLVTGYDPKPAPPASAAAVSDAAESVPDEIVVDLKDDVTEQQIGALGQSLGIALRYDSPYARASKLMVARINPADRARILAALRANPLVEHAEPQFIYHFDSDPPAGSAPPSAPASVTATRFVPNDPAYRLQWNLTMIGMEEAWTKTKGKGATVAVIDSGVGAMNSAGAYVQLQDFQQTQFVKGYDFGEGREMTPDAVGHGTHVSGTIAESTDNGLLGAGIAPEAKLMPLRVADAKGEPVMSAIADALHYAADHGANVANMSLGGPPSDILADALHYAYRKDVTLVCSAGNTGKEGVGYPARYKECIGVSAIGPTGQIADYSTWGRGVDIAAPGGDVRLGENAEIWQDTVMRRRGFFGTAGPLVDGFFPLQGTSMAAPHVSGVAALLVSLGMTDPKEIRSQLRKSVKPHGPADHYGAGILDAAKAVESVDRSSSYNRLQIWLAVGAAGLLLTIGRNLRRPTDPMYFVHQIAIALALGLFIPIGLEKFVGFGSWWNLAGHSVILAICFLIVPGLDRASFWKGAALTLGLVIHLLLDADSGRAPFLVIPQQRILFWLYVNAAVGLYFVAAAYRTVKSRLAEMEAASK